MVSGQAGQWTVNEAPRKMMREIGEHLALGEFSTSTGGTVRKDFLVAVAEALGVVVPRGDDGEVPRSVNKEKLLWWSWRQVNDGPLPMGSTSGGGTITNIALRGILEGIESQQSSPYDTEDENISASDVDEGDPSDVPDLTDLVDLRKRIVRLTKVREGQAAFRQQVLTAYEGKCCVTGTPLPEALQAAHIIEYRGKIFNHIQYGLSLRSDVHSLLDRGLIAIDEETTEVMVRPELLDLEPYGDLAGRPIRLPRHSSEHPNIHFLRAHRIGSGFRLLRDSDI